MQNSLLNVNPKKMQNVEILSLLKEFGKKPICGFNLVEIKNWTTITKEAKKRKIGPYSIKVSEAASWNFRA